MRTLFLLAALTAGVFAFAAHAQSQPDPNAPMLFVVDAATAGQRLRLQQHFDLPGACCGAVPPAGPLEVIAWPDQLGLLQSIAPAARFVRRSQPFRDIHNAMLAAGPDLPDTLYYTVAEIEAQIDQRAAAWPLLAQKVNLSTLPGGVLTHEGRPIFALKVSDNVATDEDEPAILIAAQHHARELNSPHMVIGAMERVLAAYGTDPALTALVDQYEVWFVPMVNPDGVNHVWNVYDMWRKNRRPNGGSSYGVDLNRNYPFLWGQCGASTNTSSDTYRGPAAGSEPEVRTMRNLVARLRPEIYIDFHSSGRQVLDTYAPCATVNPAIDGLIGRYRDLLRAPMTYSFRDPSASGEAPEDHWASGGTLSYLIEISTSFQPAFTETVTEEARVWPGLQQVLTGFRPALRGHVRSSQGQPLAAAITFTPAAYSHGEQAQSRARDGRYGLWLPLGAWNVTFAAPGFQSRTIPVTVTQYDAPQLQDIVLDPVGPAATLQKAGTERIGTTVTFTYQSPGDTGLLCLFGWSMGTAPGTPLGGGRVLPLNTDFLLEAALLGNPVLTPTWVVLDGQDRAQSFLHIPNDPLVLGFTTYVAGITADPSYHRLIKRWSQPVAVTPVQ